MRTRGFTLIELLVSIFILFLFLGSAYAALLPVLSFMSPAQAKVNTLENAVPLLYKLQREVRQSHWDATSSGSIYIWQAGSAKPPPSTSTAVSTFAVASAKSGAPDSPCFPGGDFVTQTSGAPLWQGFEVFMLQGGALKCVFEPLAPPLTGALPSSGDAAAAITAALGVAKPAAFGNAVLDIKMKADTTPSVVDFQITAVSTVNGRSNATTYTEDILTRN